MPDDMEKGQQARRICSRRKRVRTFDIELITIGGEELGAYRSDGGGDCEDLCD